MLKGQEIFKNLSTNATKMRKDFHLQNLSLENKSIEKEMLFKVLKLI